MADGPMGLFEAMDELRKQGAAAERRRIRRANAPLIDAAEGDIGLLLIGESDGKVALAALAAIDRATRAPKRRSPNAR